MHLPSTPNRRPSQRAHNANACAQVFKIDEMFCALPCLIHYPAIMYARTCNYYSGEPIYRLASRDWRTYRVARFICARAAASDGPVRDTPTLMKPISQLTETPAQPQTPCVPKHRSRKCSGWHGRDTRCCARSRSPPVARTSSRLLHLRCARDRA